MKALLARYGSPSEITLAESHHGPPWLALTFSFSVLSRCDLAASR
ncbi:hypothetical protein A2U01_0059131 [Trifolium medium]|uniref:Uncharacterized protein n=1 Tax=Trifolium medium TaxID=97028 RepID=A0A392RP77_9FABA|nr:hypothetical protein [Trifolium medium]